MNQKNYSLSSQIQSSLFDTNSFKLKMRIQHLLHILSSFVSCLEIENKQTFSEFSLTKIERINNENKYLIIHCFWLQIPSLNFII